MRLLICAKNDLAANLAVNHLLRRFSGDAVGIWLSDVERPAELADPDLRTLRFFERQLPQSWLWPLLGSAGDAADQRFLSFAELARRHECPLAVVSGLRRPEMQDRLAALEPDVVVSIRFSHIFPKALLDVPRLGVLNLHPGDLPGYAGLFAPFHQLLDGRPALGCTLHWVDEGIDTGPVIARRFMPVEQHRSLLWHVCRLYPHGVEVLAEVLHELRAGRPVPGEVQNPDGRRYHRLPDRAAFDRFQADGWKIVDYDDYEELLSAYRPSPLARAPVQQAASG
jgi:folate-dependent phosphoribosylglycinamide formyltransferase PurN